MRFGINWDSLTHKHRRQFTLVEAKGISGLVLTTSLLFLQRNLSRVWHLNAFIYNKRLISPEQIRTFIS